MLNVWLPLITNINDQGLSNYQFTSNNIAFTDTGKIGNNSAVFSGTNSYIYADGVSINNQWSVGCWAKVNSISSRVLFQLGAGTTAATSQFFLLLNSASQITYGCNQSSKQKTGLSLGGWHHYFLTYDGSTLSLYIDGVVVDTSTVATTYTATRLTIGSYYNFTSCFTGDMNDFRLYNNVLSAKEINELSKGLVIHYTLATPGNQNLLKDSMKNYGKQINGYLIESYQLSQSLTANTKYTISAKITATVEKRTIAFYFSGGTTAISEWLTINDTNYYTCTFTATNDIATNKSGDGHGFINVYVSNNTGAQGSTTISGSASVEWIKLEVGSTATVWSPNINDEAYSTMGYSNNVLYDTSGFKKNGTLIGNPGWTSDTPRYEGAYNFSGTGMYISTTNVNPGGFNNTWTISIWAKYKDNTIAFGYANGNKLSLYERNGCFYLGYNTNFIPFIGSGTHGLIDESNNKLTDENGNYLINTDTVSGTSYLNAWHNYVITGNGTKNDLYIDGTKMGSTGTYVNLSGTNLIISGNDTSTAYKMTNPISDFRLYSTVLSASQISDLYQIAQSLASNGTLLSSGINE